LTEYAYDFNRGIYYKGLQEMDEHLSALGAILVLVKSEDIKKSSEEHGSDLSVLEMIFYSLYMSSKIKRKIKAHYHGFATVVDLIRLEMGIDARKKAKL
jgi:hypothetical protein